MSNIRALTLQAGAYKQIQDANTLVTGNGVTTLAGSLTISAFTNSVILGASQALTAGAGASVDLSGSAGAFKTTTGAVTLAGTTTVATGKTLNTTGTGTIDLPNDGVAHLFKIENVAVGVNVTATNLTTLTAGVASNADALHTHAGLGGATYVKTSGEAIAIGALVVVNNAAGVPRLFNADAAGVSPLNRAFGVATTAAGAAGTAVTVAAASEVSVPDALWAGGVAPAAADMGAPVFLHTVAGQWSLTAPSASTQTVQPCGYVSVGGGAVDTSKVVIVFGAPVVLE